ncbi:MAG TPA: amino acid adenylation domain-containing protein, partial [Blastocatellia bacterium]|nr:amino acid adenylation domain-containing protein [Blastocatellia bacterium]
MDPKGFQGRTELSIDDRRLLNRLLEARGVELPRSHEVAARRGSDRALLSFAQQRLWFLDRLNPDSPFYNVSGALRLRGRLNIAVLERSLAEIIRRHEALRTTFATVNDRPVQVVNAAEFFELPCVKVTGSSKAGREAAGVRLASEEATRPFNLATGPLIRALLLQLEEEDSILLVSMHHIVCDGWSIGIFIKELAALYESFSRGRPSPFAEPPIQYSDFARWQREYLRGEILASHLDYWRRELAGAPSALNLPTDRPRPPAQTYRGGRHSFQISGELTEAIKTISQLRGATLFMFLLAAFKVLLCRYSRQEDIVVGTPVAGRSRVETEGLIGCFVNTLVLRSDLSKNPRFIDLLGKVRATTIRAFEHQAVPFEKLVEELHPERDISRSPLFQVMFVMQNAPLAELKMAGIELMPVELQAETAKFDLTLTIEEAGRGLNGSIEYSTDLFDRSTIVRMAEHLQTLLESIAANPRERIGHLQILTNEERRLLIETWNETARDFPQHELIHHLFERQAALTPKAVAITDGRNRLTYRELNRRSNRLANYLKSRGVSCESLVGICLDRSIDMVVGLLGILKAGGAYVPLDPAYPEQRLAYMMRDAGLRFVVTKKGLIEQGESDGAELVFIDAGWKEIARHSHKDAESGASAQNLAYVIYTSGSTGRPKGVAIQHSSAVQLLYWAKDVFGPEEIRGVLAATSVCFDLSVFEIFVPLSWGGRIILAENALQLASHEQAGDVRLINTVPSAMSELIRMKAVGASVRTVNLAGEPLPGRLRDSIYGLGTVERLLNLYGPTEDTTYSTFSLVPNRTGDPPTIGRAIANTQVYILDKNLEPTPVGVVGEAYLGGEGLARGYLNQPALTAERFIPNSFGRAGGRLYKTGDLARWTAGGELEYLGRIDHQVKVRGFRIEPGEIESVLSQHPAVREAVVVAREDASGSIALVGYVVCESGATPTITELRSHIKEKLPEYMVPSALVLLDRLPMTPNGKIDRARLPEP